MKKILLLLFVLIFSFTFLVACNKVDIDDIIITPEEINETSSNISDNLGENDDVTDVVGDIKDLLVDEKDDVKDDLEEIKNTFSLKDVDEFSIVVNDPLVGKPNYGPNEAYEMNMVLSPTKFPDLDHIVISFNPLCSKPSTIRVVVTGSLVAEEAFACDEVHEVMVPKSVLSEGYNTILIQSKVRDDFYLDKVEIIFHYDGKEPEVYPGDNYFFKDDDIDDVKTLQRLSDLTLANVVTRTFKLDEDELIEPIYLEFELSLDDANLIILLNDEPVPYESKKGDVMLLLPKSLLKEGTNELRFVALEE